MSPDALTFLAPAFAAGALIALVHVPLGQEVLRRGIIFLDLAVAQFAALGMIAFAVLFPHAAEHGFMGRMGPMAAGLAAALACALAFHVLERKTRTHQEALIGCAFVLAASLGLLLVASDPHGGENIKDILAGQILWTGWGDVLLVIPVYGVALAAWSLFPARRAQLFYPLFALTIPVSVGLIGVYLVFASLVFPALATATMARGRYAAGVALSLAGYAGGLAVSYALDWPAGPAIVLALAVVAGLAAVMSRSACAPHRPAGSERSGSKGS